MKTLKKIALKRDEKDFIVLNAKGKYLGIISSIQIMQLEIEPKAKIKSYIEKIPGVSLTQNLGEALDLLLSNNLDKVAVINESERFMGYIRYQEILELYFSKLRK